MPVPTAVSSDSGSGPQPEGFVSAPPPPPPQPRHLSPDTFPSSAVGIARVLSIAAVHPPAVISPPPPARTAAGGIPTPAAAENASGSTVAAGGPAAAAHRYGSGQAAAGVLASTGIVASETRRGFAREQLAQLMHGTDPACRTTLHRMHLPPHMWAYWLSAPEEVQVGIF